MKPCHRRRKAIRSAVKQRLPSRDGGYFPQPGDSPSIKTPPSTAHFYDRFCSAPRVIRELELFGNATALSLRLSPPWESFASRAPACELHRDAAQQGDAPDCQRCAEFHAGLFARAGVQRREIQCVCFSGLLSEVRPVFCHGELLAFLWVAGVRQTSGGTRNKRARCDIPSTLAGKIERLPMFSEQRWEAVSQLLGRLANLLGTFAEELREPDSALEPEEKAMQWLEENALSVVTMDQLASVAGTVPQNLHRRWHARFAETPRESLARIRIHHALRLLESQPNRKIIDVSLASGFGSLSQFNRTFRQIVGKSPSNLRSSFSSSSPP